jgi:hypothetical protein
MDFILLDLQQLGYPMGHTPPSPSVGHPGLPDPGTVDGTPMKYTHTNLEQAQDARTKRYHYRPWQLEGGSGEEGKNTPSLYLSSTEKS